MASYRVFAFSVLLLGGITAPVRGFSLYDAELLDVTLGEECINALAADIDCIEHVKSFMELRYRGSLEDVAFTDAVCTGTCSGSLKSWFDSVSDSCSGKSLDGAIPTKFGGYMWAGFNETCVKDPKTKSYCNDIIDEFSDVADITEMPREELCHTCHRRRLVMMQSSQYSTYDEFWKEQLEYLYAQCGGSGPTEIPPPLSTTQPEPAPYCLTNKRYTTKKGDTCESISESTGVSSAALYMGNQVLLPDCLDIDAGILLCVPLGCETYRVGSADTCTTIELALDLESGQVRSWNPWINADCSNLQPATDFYGKLVCVSPQGGTHTGAPPTSGTTPGTGGGDGYTTSPVAPPEGADVAEGTTRSCGKWHTVEASDTCSTICLQAGITIRLLYAVNPSLDSEGCTLSLHPGTAICVGPTYTWNMTAPISTATAVESLVEESAAPTTLVDV